MHFVAPIALALAALLPVIAVMYLLRLRRTQRIVSSVYLWQRMVRDVEANAPWQRLRRNLLLILQLLFLSAVILALAQPFTWAAGRGGNDVIMIFDVSASMAMTDVYPSRLDVAKSQAHRFVDDLATSGRVTVIAGGDGAQVLLSSSEDKRSAHRAIDEIDIAAIKSDLGAALELASAISARQPDTEIIVYSDGRVTLPDRLILTGQVRYVPVGRSGYNQAISALALRRAVDEPTLSAFVQVANYGDTLVQRRLVVYANEQLVDAYDLEIAPRDRRAVIVDSLAVETDVVEARLIGTDGLGIDDRAWAVHRDSTPVKVTLVTEGNLFLETGLALLPGLEVTTVRPADWQRTDATGRKVNQEGDQSLADTPGLTVFDAYVPVTVSLPIGNLLFVAPPRSTAYFSVTGKLEYPVPQVTSASDPLLSHVKLDEVSVLEAARLVPRSGMRTVVAGTAGEDRGPLLLAGQYDHRRVAVLAFDLRRSDLPLHVAFPLLLVNVTTWLTPGNAGSAPAQVEFGAAVSLALPLDAQGISLARPDGSVAWLASENGQITFADTQQFGVYDLTWKGGRSAFAVNLFSPQESDAEPKDVLPLLGLTDGKRDPVSQRARREWWRPIGYVGLALLVLEWLYYQRSALARLIGWVRGRE